MYPTNPTVIGTKRSREEDTSLPNAKRQRTNPNEAQIQNIALQTFIPVPYYNQAPFLGIYPTLEPTAPPAVQIETIQALEQEYCFPCDIESLKMLSSSFILTEQDFVKATSGTLAQKKLAPFVLRPKNLALFREEMKAQILKDLEDEKQTKKTAFLESSLIRLGNGNLVVGIDKKAAEMAEQVCGDFQLVGSFYNRKTLAKTTKQEFMRIEAISILADGRIQHGHGKGRVYNSFEELKADWGLGDFLYDAYIKQQSDFADGETVRDALLQAPVHCCLIWKKAHTQARFVSIRQENSVTCFQILFREGKCFLEQTGASIEVSGELFTFLANTFHVSMYKQATDLVQQVNAYLDTNGHDLQEHSLQRLLNLHAFHYPVINQEYFTLSIDRSGLFMKTYKFHNKNWEEQSYGICVLPNASVVLTNKTTLEKKTQSCMEFVDTLKSKNSVKSLEKAREENGVNSKKIQEIIQEIIREAKSKGCFREYLFQAEQELKGYWSLLGEKCSHKGLLTKDPHKDTLMVLFMDSKGEVQTREFTITAAGVIVGNIMSTSLLSLFAHGIVPLSDNDHAFKHLRETFLSSVAQCPAYVSLPLLQEMESLSALLSVVSPKTYAFGEKLDAQGVRQVYFFFINKNHQMAEISVPTMDALYQLQGKNGQDVETALCQLVHWKQPSILFGQPFTTIKPMLIQSLPLLEAKCTEIKQMAQFTNVTQQAAEKSFQDLRQFFYESYDIMKDCFLIRPSKGKGVYEISIGRQNKTEHHEIIINPNTSKYHLGNEAVFDSMLALLTQLQLTKSYKEVWQLKALAETREQEVYARLGPCIITGAHGVFELSRKSIDENRFLGRPIIKTRQVPGSFVVSFTQSHATYLCNTIDELIKELS